MPPLLLSISALAAGRAVELERFSRALHSPGFFACELDDWHPDLVAEGGLLANTYAVSRRVLRGRSQKGVNVYNTELDSIGAKPQRWWFTAVRGRRWDWAEGHAGAEEAVLALDTSLVAVAGVLAGAVAYTLQVPRESLAEAPLDAMLTVRRYPRASSGMEEGLPSHVDYGYFTLCHGDRDGLEAWDREALAWRRLPAGMLHFLAGAGLEKRSAGRIPAVQHRVCLSESERFSMCRLHGVVTADPSEARSIV